VEIVLLALLAVAAVVLALWMVLAGSSSIEGYEGNVVSSFNLLLGGGELYPDPTHFPIAATQYSPLQYQIVVGLAHLFGIEAGSARALYLLGRAVSTLCLVVTALLLAAEVWRRRRDWLLTGAMAAAVVAYTLPWSVVVRADAGSSLFGFVALLLYVRYAPGVGTLIAIVLALTVSVLFKQSGVVFVGCIFLHQLVERRFASAAAVAIGPVIVLVAYMLAFRGQFGDDAILQLVANVSNGIDLKDSFFERFLVGSLKSHAPIIAAGLAIMALDTWRLGMRPKAWLRAIRRQPMGLWLFVLFGYAMVTGLKRGSAPNYLDDWLLLVSLVVLLRIRKWRFGLSAALVATGISLAIVGWQMRSALLTDELGPAADVAAQLRAQFPGMTTLLDFDWHPALATEFSGAIDLDPDVVYSRTWPARITPDVTYANLPSGLHLVIGITNRDPASILTDPLLHNGRTFDRTGPLSRFCPKGELVMCFTAAPYVLR